MSCMDWPSRTVQLSSFPPQCLTHWSSLNKDSSTDSTVCTLVFTQQGLFNRQHRMHFGPHSTRTLQQTALCSFWSSLNKDSSTDSTVCTLVLTQQGLFNRQHFVHSGLHSTRTLQQTALCSFWSSLSKDYSCFQPTRPPPPPRADSTPCCLVFTQQRLHDCPCCSRINMTDTKQLLHFDAQLRTL